MIDNPDYKGEWIHPMIPNPDFIEDKELYVRCKDCTHVGFELWQVKAGTIFDDIIVTDSLEEANAFADKTFNKKKGPEKAAFEAHEAARKKADEEAAGAGGAADDEEDHDEL
jgi:calreticulin